MWPAKATRVSPAAAAEAFAQRFGVAGDAFHGLQRDVGVGPADGLDVLAEILDDAMGRLADMGAQGVGALGHLLHGGAGGGCEFVSNAGAMRVQGLRESVARGAEQVLRMSRFVAQALAEAVAERGERILQGRTLNRDDLMQAVGLVFEPSGQVVGAAADGVAEAGADIFQGLRQGVRAGVDLFEEGVGEGLQIAIDLDAARLDGVGRFLARALEAFEQGCGARFKLQHHGVAGPGEGRFEVAALVFESADDASAGLVEQAGQFLGCRLEFAGDAVLGMGQGGGDAVGVDDDGFTLAGQFIEQQADAALVLAIGALERGNLGPDHGFHFAGAGQRAFDAVAHRGDLAANGLAQTHHLFGGDGFRLRQPDRHFRHRAGGMAHFLRASQNRAHGQEEDDRTDQREGGNGGGGTEQRTGEGGRMGEHDIADPQAGPGGGSNDRHGHAGGVGSGLEALQNLANRRAIIVGGQGAGRHNRARRVGFTRTLAKFIDGGVGQARRRRD